MLATALSAIPALGAERIAFFYPPFGEFSLSIDALEAFAKEGRITNEFEFYAKRANPQQLASLRNLLSGRLQVSPTLVSQFTYSPVGEMVLQSLGELLQTDSRLNGFHALRSSFILAATDPQGLTVLNMLRRFPSRSIRVNLDRSLEITRELSQLLKQKDEIVAAVKQQAAVEAATQPEIDFSKQRDLRLLGPFSWQQQTLLLNDRSRNVHAYSCGRCTMTVDLYLPQLENQGINNQSAPVILISHGAGEDRTSFVYLAQHLVSYGFAVAVLDHPGSNSYRFQQFFAGLAGPPEPIEWVNRPMEVKYVLDELQRLDKSDPSLQGRLNLQQVGVIGHSLGGYTALLLAGAKINFEQLGRNCNKNELLNISILVQCRVALVAPALYPRRDERIKAVIAVNPVTSIIFGQSGLSQIQVPLMLVAGSSDIVTPAVPEQIRPFTWLTTSNKYLVLIENGTHFSTVGESVDGRSVLPIPLELIGPNPVIARRYLNALSVAFFESHIANRPEYRSYLSASYAKFLSQALLSLELVQFFAVRNLENIPRVRTPKASSSGVQSTAPRRSGIN